jgi:peptide/nickel transport system substrate-binding protein
VILSFDLEAEPWNDIHVRRAVAHCCDTAGYAKAFLGGQATPATSMVSKGQWSNVADADEVDALYSTLPQYAYSLDEARAELAKSAFPDGFSATVPYLNTYPPIGRALVSLGESLKQIGIDLTVKPLTEAQWLSTVFEHKDLGLQVIPYSPDYNDPSNYPLVFLPSANAAPNALNTANFKNSSVDRLLDEQASTPDNKERTRLLGDVLEIVGKELPYFPLWWEGPALAINDEYVYNGFNPLYYFQAWLNDIGVPA